MDYPEVCYQRQQSGKNVTLLKGLQKEPGSVKQLYYKILAIYLTVACKKKIKNLCTHTP